MNNSIIQSEIDSLIKRFDEELTKGNFTTAQSIIKEIESLQNFLSIKLQKSLNKNIKGIFLQNDPELDSMQIHQKIRNFLEELKNEYSKYIIDEITILRLHGDFVLPVYYYSININNFIEQIDNINDLENLKNQLTKDLKFFVENVINKGGLDDGEGTLAGNQTGNSYDIILRYGDFLICFNNSEESVETLNKKLGIDMESLIQKVSSFYKEFKK